MEYAPVRLPDTPPGGVTAGIDGASAGHAVCVVGAAGVVMARFAVQHTAAGFAALVRGLARAGVGEAAIERSDGPRVDALLAAGVTVVVITPRQIKNLRSRYGSAGTKDDRLRRIRARRRAAHRPGPAEAADPGQPGHRHAAPGPAGPARTWSATGPGKAASCAPTCWPPFPAGRALLRAPLGDHPGVPGPLRLPGPRRLAVPETSGRLAESRRLRGRTSPAGLYQRLRAAPRGATGEHGAASAQVTRALAAVLATLNTQIKHLEAQIAAQLASHPDGRIFTSLPRSGTVRAARLRTEIGDCRAKFPDPQALICLAGAAPSTRQSGTHKAVTFRWAVRKQLRDAVCDFADGSRHANAWAAQIHNDAIARGKDHPLAVRILARAWLHVIWECWHNGTAYDPARHRALQRLLAAKDAAAEPAA
jgi:transposase